MLLNAMVVIFGVIIFCRKVEVEFLIKNQGKKEGERFNFCDKNEQS